MLQRHNSAAVAPLHIRKDTSRVQQYTASATSPEPNDALQSPRPRFQTYLRAAYPFQPASAPSQTTVTLPLNSGDIVLVHSVHTNGWADGTLLETGERGWLPTNYCEPYDYIAMRPLLRSLTEFWDIMRTGSDSTLAVFQNKDYMRGLVAGVRYLLEKCDCLTRDAPNVRKHDAVRRTRKGLLSDLSLLVKAGKELQVLIPSQATEMQLDPLLDELLLHAFKIVTRAVKFFDIWGEIVSSLPPLPALEGPDVDLLPEEYDPDRKDSLTTSNRHTGSTARYSQFGSAIYTSHISTQHALDSIPSFPHTQTQPEKRVSISHRMSYSARPTNSTSPNLVSERLTYSYDAFLGVLASFLGSHMQSRCSSELLLTTQQAVKSCRQLLTVVEAVIERDLGVTEALTESKDTMYDAITDLVLAAKQVFRPLQASEDDYVYLPEEGRKLVQAATTCVSRAGRCVAQTRAVLEDEGDFEIDDIPSEQTTDSYGGSPARMSYVEPPSIAGLQISGLPSQSEFSSIVDTKPQRPTLAISVTDVQTPPMPSAREGSPSTLNSPIPRTPDDRHLNLTSTSETTLHSPIMERPVSNEYAIAVGHLRHKSLVRSIIQSTGSDSTCDSTHAMTDASNMSTASTRATSFGDPVLKFSSQESLVNSLAPPLEEEDDEAVISQRTFAHELIFNREGGVIGGTINALVERLTAHDSTPDALFLTTIYLTFRLFVRPLEFVDALVYRFRYIAETPTLASPVRLRVYNAFKGWLESHWRHDCDDVALPSIIDFARNDLQPVLPSACKRLLELVEVVSSTHSPAVPRVVSAIGKTSTSTAAFVNPDTPLPAPILSKSQLTALRTWKMGGASVGILDFDAMELARQITLKTSQIFCSILPEELLATEWTKQSSSLAVNVRAMSTLSTDISNLVADSILQIEDPKKRALTIKQWIKIAAKCLELHNFDTLFAIVCSIDSTNIKRMKKTWDMVPQKSRNLLDDMKRVTDFSKNYSNLRSALSTRVPPCIPFLGMYLTDLTFIDHGNQATRELNLAKETVQVINLDKHMRTARIISDLQRFQIPYRFTEVSELQTWMQDQLIRVRSEGEKNYQNHYRRSLILEPKEMAKVSPNPGIMKDRFDFLAWTHIGKDRSQNQSPAITS
jgi:hypothetical protein